ncbi:MAG TPA: hypothetical protein VHZ26_14950 [Caulobacteraceae bacterium]|jgi:hypothetical protein|nr:hypothetical protein [Caulobacteraceae bacterium]
MRKALQAGAGLIAPVCIAAVAVLGAGVAAAQTPPCQGSLTVIRDSAILPGKMPLFEKAVADQTAWYATHGDTATPKLLKILRRDPQTGAMSYAADEAMTATVHRPGVKSPPHDAAWNSFVAEFQASSTIKSETAVCWPGR